MPQKSRVTWGGWHLKLHEISREKKLTQPPWRGWDLLKFRPRGFFFVIFFRCFLWYIFNKDNRCHFCHLTTLNTLENSRELKIHSFGTSNVNITWVFIWKYVWYKAQNSTKNKNELKNISSLKITFDVIFWNVFDVTNLCAFWKLHKNKNTQKTCVFTNL